MSSRRKLVIALGTGALAAPSQFNRLVAWALAACIACYGNELLGERQ